MIWRSKFCFKIVIWRVSDNYSIQNAPLKLWSLRPATCTQPAQLSLSETNCCCRRQLSCCPVAVNPEFISVPRRSASSFNSNTVRSCDESPQFGWVWSTLHGCTTRMPDAQVSGLLTPSMWCLNTKHVMGWDEDASRASWQTNSFKNMVSFFIVLLLPRRINWLRLVTCILDECALAKWNCIFPKPGKLVPSNLQLPVPLNFGGASTMSDYILQVKPS
jgi:hypothetical protein